MFVPKTKHTDKKHYRHLFDVPPSDVVEPKRREFGWSDVFTWKYWTCKDPLYLLDPTSRAYQRIEKCRQCGDTKNDHIIPADHVRHGSESHKRWSDLLAEGKPVFVFWSYDVTEWFSAYGDDQEIVATYLSVFEYAPEPAPLPKDDGVLISPYAIMIKEDRITKDVPP